MTGRTARPLSEIASEPTFRTIDGLSIRFIESDRRNADALLFSPWPESVFAYEPRVVAAVRINTFDRGRSPGLWPIRAQRRVDGASRDGRLHR